MTDALADVKAAVFVARRGDNVGSKESMVSVIETISKRMEVAEKPQDIKSDAFFAVLMNIPELSSSFDRKREELAGSSTGINPPPVTAQCSQVQTQMFHPRSMECQISPDSCVKGKLILFGWRERISTDTCRSTEADQRICLMYVSHWKKDNGACKFALNSCEADDLEKGGFSRVDPSTCEDTSDDYVDSSPPVNVPPPICAPVSAIMVNPVNNQCIRARHSCDEFRLAQEGFKRTKLSACPGSTLNQSSSTGSTTPR
jgi:hypothetical protein